MITIAVDAMGGDKAPVPEVEGAILAARQFGHRIILVGDRDEIHLHLKGHASAGTLPIEVLHATDRITMDDHAAKAARSKKGSSMHLCARLVADGKADGFSLRRQHRGMHGHRQNGAGQVARGGSPRALRRLPFP